MINEVGSIKVWENPLYDGTNARWMGSLNTLRGVVVRSGDTQEEVRNELMKLSTSPLAET